MWKEEFSGKIKNNLTLDRFVQIKTEEVSLENQNDFGKMDIVSDESQESCSQLGVEKLRINEMEPSNSLDSDNSLRLEINEKSMSESRESDDSIMNQMSPISQGRLTPELSETDKPYEEDAENSKMLNFIGRIPKIKPEDLESARMSNKNEGIISERKNANSSDESNGYKSYEKNDFFDKKEKNIKKEDKKFSKDEKHHKEDVDKRRKDDERYKNVKEREIKVDRQKDKEKENLCSY